MKIGIFDSGLGGLIITKSFIDQLPQYDYVYLGDTARVPYGNRSQDAIYQFSREALEYLFALDCALVIIACNTASAEALWRLQQEVLPHYPNRKVLGVIVPAAEIAISGGGMRIGVLATTSTVKSCAYVTEITKISPSAVVFQQAAPLLVPLVENDGAVWAPPILESYLEPLLRQQIDTLVLGCTHYPFLKAEIKIVVGNGVHIVSQDEFLPTKLANYLAQHKDLESRLSKTGQYQFFITDQTASQYSLASKLFGQPIAIENIGYLPKVAEAHDPSTECG
jgi:glutamate racemase